MAKGNWIAVLTAVLIIAGVSDSTLIAGLFYALLAVVLLALYVARHPARLRAASRAVSTFHAEIGKRVSIGVAVDWQKPIGPGWVLVRDSIPPPLVPLEPVGRLFISLGRRKASYYYRIQPKQRGYYPIGPVSVSCGDLFGVSHTDSNLTDRIFLTVYPKVLPVPELQITSNRPIGALMARHRLFEDPTRTVGVRDYAAGDSLSRVHWKASARAGELQSRIYESSTNLEVNILLNLHSDDYPGDPDEVELACTTAASLAARLLARNQLVGILSNGFDAAWRYNGIEKMPAGRMWIKAKQGGLQLKAILAEIARMELSEDKPLSNYLTEVHSRLEWTAALLIITHHLDERSIRAMDALKRSGFTLACIIAGGGEVAEESLYRAGSLSIPIAWVQEESHLASLSFQRPGRV